jgi:hypothetical protein
MLDFPVPGHCHSMKSFSALGYDTLVNAEVGRAQYEWSMNWRGISGEKTETHK